jgi:hypothetical protein
MTSLYRQILKKAWLIAKKYFYLWPLGFFVAFLGNGGEYQILMDQIDKVQKQPQNLSYFKSLLASPAPILDISLGRAFLVGLFLFVILVIIALIVWLVISSVAGLTRGVADITQNKKNSFQLLLKDGSKHFGPVFSLYLISKVIIYSILAFIFTPLMLVSFAQGNYALNVLIIVLAFLIFVPINIIVSFVTRYATAYVVLQGQKMWEAFKNGWRLFAANWLISLEMAFILLIINSVVALGILVLAFLLFSPFFFIGLAVTATQNPYTFWSIIMIPLIIAIIMVIVVGSGLATFQVSSWTLLFMRLNEGKKAYSKIVRWLAALTNKASRKNV